MHTRHSSQDYSHSKQERSSHSMNYEYRRHKRDSSAADKHRRQDVEDTNGRQFSPMGNDSKCHRHKHEERHRSDHGNGEKKDDDKTRPRKHYSDRHGSLDLGYSDWPPDFTDTDISKAPSGEKSTTRYDDAKRRHSCKGTRLGRKDDDPDIEVRHQRSSRSTKDDKRRKHHSGNRRHSGTEEGTSDSSRGDLSSDSWSRRSRSSENFSAHRSKRKRSQSKKSS